MKNSKRVRVVILNFNRVELTLRCVESVRQQQYANLDIVVVDNCSTSEDKSELNEVVRQGVGLIWNQRNSGYAAGNNCGMRAPGWRDCEYMLIVNNDAVLENADIVSRLVEAIEQSNEYVAASPLVYDPLVGSYQAVRMQTQVRRVPTILQSLVVHSWWLSRLFPAVMGRYVYADARPFLGDAPIACETINGSCFIIKTAFLESIGFLEEATFLYFEELILGVQMRWASRSACLVPSICIIHYQGGTTGEFGGGISLSRRLSSLRSELVFNLRYLGCPIIFVPVLLVIRLIDVASKMVIKWIIGK